MAWASKEEKAMAMVKQHMVCMDYDRKCELIEYYARSIFSGQGDRRSNVIWRIHYGVVYVSMWDDEHLLKNLKYAMIVEMLGMGPYKYCIINTVMARFERNLMLLVYYLPATMAWGSKAEEAMSIVEKHMSVMDFDRKKELYELYVHLIFPERQTSWSHAPWITCGGITFVTMWNNEHLLRNIRFAMMVEIMGIGPHKYCIVSNEMPNFEAKLMLLMAYLPRQKLCFYPPLFVLGNPFQRQPWRHWARMASLRQMNCRHPMARTVYHTQQFVIFLLTGVYEPSFWV